MPARAVWSITGALLGLGDRHGENLLIVESSGECVHVDFDCLFDKATDLAVPEVCAPVPACVRVPVSTALRCVTGGAISIDAADD